MIKLHTFGPAFGLPDGSPFVVKAHLLLRMAGLEYEAVRSDPRKAPKGKLPYIDDGGTIVADSGFIRRHIEKTQGVDFDKGLTAPQKGQAYAIEKMLDRARVDFSKHQEAASRDALLSRLTTREAQVLERIVAGRLNKQIADDLGISIKTVEAHRANIMEKLNANTVADLLKIALGQNAPSKG